MRFTKKNVDPEGVRFDSLVPGELFAVDRNSNNVFLKIERINKVDDAWGNTRWRDCLELASGHTKYSQPDQTVWRVKLVDAPTFTHKTA